MLVELAIRNLAIIEQLRVRFDRGFNVLTGETGAGKSIIVDAVGLVLGGRASADLIRAGAEEAEVEALFDLEGLDATRSEVAERELGDGEELLVRRVVARSGKSRVLVNGHAATAAMLGELTEGLVDIYGQHEHHSLLRVEAHLEILDAFGALHPVAARMAEAHRRLTALLQELRACQTGEEAKAHRMELLTFQLEELRRAALQPGEDAALQEERTRLANAERLQTGAALAHELLYAAEGSAVERAGVALGKIRELARLDPQAEELVKALEAGFYALEEVARAVRAYGEGIAGDPARLEAVEARLHEIARLKRKYGETIEEVLAYQGKVESELQGLATQEARIAELQDALGRERATAAALAAELTARRQEVAETLSRRVEKELGTLGMKRTRFRVALEPQAPGPADPEELCVDGRRLTPRGADRAEFLIAPNVGEELRPLTRIASGGELSRIMLALKRILARELPRATLIFDEVDAGIGGATAEVVGRKLREVSRHHQVLGITHLPQIAAFGHHHLLVAKEVERGRTVVVARQLGGEERVEELARMLGGVSITAKTRAHAREMLERATAEHGG
ncbi:MAG: DNA repair protein RecN [Deltaproteobacteria bacterium]|nr:DNA repair protein RecN [Deltaproteobacteria bacterium]